MIDQMKCHDFRETGQRVTIHIIKDGIIDLRVYQVYFITLKISMAIIVKWKNKESTNPKI